MSAISTRDENHENHEDPKITKTRRKKRFERGRLRAGGASASLAEARERHCRAEAEARKVLGDATGPLRGRDTKTAPQYKPRARVVCDCGAVFVSQAAGNAGRRSLGLRVFVCFVISFFFSAGFAFDVDTRCCPNYFLPRYTSSVSG